MSTPRADSTRLAQELNQELRRLAGGTVLFHQAVAERLGLHATDLRCLDLVLGAGSLTAGRLAELTALTTSSITSVIDRLEQAGYVRRGKDPLDRRRVVIEPVIEKAEREVAPLFASMGRAMMELCSHYSPEELALIIDFVRRTHPVTEAEIGKLRESPGKG